MIILEASMSLLIPDSRRRVTLPPEFKPGQPVELVDSGDGTFLLVPMVAVPVRELERVAPGLIPRTEGQ